MGDKAIMPRIKEQHKDYPVEVNVNMPAKNELLRENVREKVDHEKTLRENEEVDFSEGFPSASCDE